jgi:hypothetical protein
MNLLKIECIGNPRQGAVPAWVDWVKDIGPGGMEKVRLKGQTDYSEANSVGSRGVYKYYFLSEGELYHISSPKSWKTARQYFCRIEQDETIELSFEEAVQWLLKRKRERMYSTNPVRGSRTYSTTTQKSMYRSPGAKTQA